MHFSALIFVFSWLPIVVLLVAGWMDSQRKLLSPFLFMMFSVGVGTAAKITYLYAAPSNRLVASFAGLSDGELMRSVMTILVFIALCCLAYFASQGQSGIGRSQSGDSMPLLHLANPSAFLMANLVILAVAGTATIALLSSSGFELSDLSAVSKKRVMEDGSSGGVYRATIQLAEVNCLVLFLIFMQVRNGMQRLWIQFACAASSVVCLASCVLLSSRTSIILLVAPIIAYMHYRKAIRLSHVGAAVLLLGFIGASIGALRSTKYDSSLEDILQGVVEAPRAVAEVENCVEITKIARIIDHYGDGNKYLGGYSLPMAMMAIVPRQIWPGKPKNYQLNLDHIVTYEVYAQVPGKDTGAKPPTIIGEAFMNFGYVGVVLTAVLYGFGLQVFMSWWLQRGQGSMWKTIVFLIALPVVTHLLMAGYSTIALIRFLTRIASAYPIYAFYRLFCFRPEPDGSGDLAQSP